MPCTVLIYPQDVLEAGLPKAGFFFDSPPRGSPALALNW